MNNMMLSFRIKGDVISDYFLMLGFQKDSLAPFPYDLATTQSCFPCPLVFRKGGDGRGGVISSIRESVWLRPDKAVVLCWRTQKTSHSAFPLFKRHLDLLPLPDFASIGPTGFCTKRKPRQKVPEWQQQCEGNWWSLGMVLVARPASSSSSAGVAASMWTSWLYCYHWSSGMSFPRSMCRQSLKTMSLTSRLLFSFSSLTILKMLCITYDDGLVIDHGRGGMDDDGDNGQVDGIKVELEMWDTAGQEDYDRNQTSSIITITNTITTIIFIITTTIIPTTLIIGCDRCPTRTPTWSYSVSPSTLPTLLRTSQTAGRRNSNIFVPR